MSAGAAAHATVIAVEGPAEVAAGDEFALTILVSCPAGCDLSRVPIEVVAPDNAKALAPTPYPPVHSREGREGDTDMAVARRILCIFQQSCITATGSCQTFLLDFIISPVGKPQHHLAEGLAEFVFLRQKFEARPLDCERSVQNHVAVSDKHGSRNFARHRRNKAHRS